MEIFFKHEVFYLMLFHELGFIILILNIIRKLLGGVELNGPNPNIEWIYWLVVIVALALVFGRYYKKLLKESLYYVGTFILCEVCNFLLGVTLWISLSDLQNELTLIEKMVLSFAIVYMVFNTLNHIMAIYHAFHEICFVWKSVMLRTIVNIYCLITSCLIPYVLLTIHETQLFVSISLISVIAIFFLIITFSISTVQQFYIFENSQSYELDKIKGKRRHLLAYLVAVPLSLSLSILFLLIALGVLGLLNRAQIHDKDKLSKEITMDSIHWQKSSFEWVLVISIGFSYVRDAWHVSGLTGNTYIPLARLPLIKSKFDAESDKDGNKDTNEDLDKV